MADKRKWMDSIGKFLYAIVAFLLTAGGLIYLFKNKGDVDDILKKDDDIKGDIDIVDDEIGKLDDEIAKIKDDIDGIEPTELPDSDVEDYWKDNV